MIKNNQSGQIIVVLLLVMLVVLSVVLAITQRSTTDLSSSTETEQSTRAYSAAEAGLEQALQRGPNPVPLATVLPILTNQATTTIQNSGLLPVAGSQLAIEYPPVGRESIAQFWLVDPTIPANNYTRNTFYIYFGNPTSQKAYDDNAGDNAQNITPAIEVTTVKQTTIGSNVTYETQKNFYDALASRAVTNKFTTAPSASLVCGGQSVNTILKAPSNFLCRAEITILNCDLSTCLPQLVRVRLLYGNVNHKIALAPTSGGSLPPQVELYTSTGKAGQSVKTLQVFRIKDMLPPWLDFAIFSVNDIVK
jgi:hypothetical protein